MNIDCKLTSEFKVIIQWVQIHIYVNNWNYVVTESIEFKNLAVNEFEMTAWVLMLRLIKYSEWDTMYLFGSGCCFNIHVKGIHIIRAANEYRISVFCTDFTCKIWQYEFGLKKDTETKLCEFCHKYCCHNHLIFIIEILISGKMVFILEWGPELGKFVPTWEALMVPAASCLTN